MKTLAIEYTSPQGSVALLEHDELVAYEAIQDKPQRSGDALFSALEQVRSHANWNWSDIELFAAGRGPGRYSGMRVALTAVKGLALPGNTRVRAISSGSALAHALADTHRDAQRIMIAGDARRGQCWFGVFSREKMGLHMVEQWQLAALSETAKKAHEACLVASSEWDRLKSLFDASSLDYTSWKKENVYPNAVWVARLAHKEELDQSPAEPLSAMYLHPAVG